MLWAWGHRAVMLHLPLPVTNVLGRASDESPIPDSDETYLLLAAPGTRVSATQPP